MRSLNKIDEYANLVCQNIRWKKARSHVSEEIKNHLIDGRDSYMEQGFDEDAATDKSISESGDAVIVGNLLDRVHRPKPQWYMFAWVAGFLLFGLLISFTVFDNTDISTRLLWTAIGVVVMFGAYFADFTLLGKHPWKVFLCIPLLAWFIFFTTSPFSPIFIQFLHQGRHTL